MICQIEMCQDELNARALLASVNDPDQGMLIVGRVFKAMWSSSLTVEHINELAAAMFSMTGFEAGPALTRLAKAKVLRSYVKQGRRRYELAL